MDDRDVASMLFVLRHTGDSYGQIIGALELWHENHGTRDPKRTAMLQACVLVRLVVDGMSYELVAESVGISRRSVGRHVRDLVAVFPPLAGWLQARRQAPLELSTAAG